MKLTAHYINEKNELVTVKEGADGLSNIPVKTILAIDGSTSTTGLAFMGVDTASIIASMAVQKEDGVSAVRYKVELKRLVTKLLRQNRNIQAIYYEEPFIEYVSAASKLFMLRTFVEELIIENEPEFEYLKHYEINNKKWKKLFLAPDKCPTGRDKEKKAVRDKLISWYPCLSEITQDEVDAIGMGYVACSKLRDGGSSSELESKKTARAFAYEQEFMGADDDDSLLMDLLSCCDVPKVVLDNGIALIDLPKRASLEKYIYEKMSSSDKLLIIKFDPNYHGNLVLKHRIGFLAAEYTYIYAIVWRKNRKKIIT